MRRLFIAAVMCAAVAFVVATGAADGSPKAQVRVKVVHGGEINVAPLDVTGIDAYQLRCPHGYLVSGTGVLNGATEVVFADPDVSGRSASFSFANPSEDQSFTASGTIVCVSGARGLRAVHVAAARERQSAIEQARAALR